MELEDALVNASEILDEERNSPTVSYSDSLVGERGIVGLMAAPPGPQYLQSLRSHRPRQVIEDPRRFVFKSTNYQLLVALLSQIARQSRPDFIHSTLLRLLSVSGCRRSKYVGYPGWSQFVSELPLIAELAIRNAAAHRLCRILGEATPSPGHVILLRHLEDMIALNFTILTKAEYQQLSFSVGNFAQTAKRELAHYGKKNVTSVLYPDVGSVDMQAALREIVVAAESIHEECRKASYLYVKISLSEGLNVEVNQDRDAVENYLGELGFSKVLIDCLNEADRLYHGSATAFDLKSSMGHLRSFMESLQAEAVEAIIAGGTPSSSQGWGACLAFLRQNNVLSTAEEKFAAGLYGLISDEAVHPLVAEKEYARLTRNMVIEYALLFLKKLEKKGLKRT